MACTEDIRNKEVLPKSALALFSKYYCSIRNKSSITDQRILDQEVTRSWLTLSTSEKQTFLNKYADLQARYKKKIALYLKDAQPYLKTKKRYNKEVTNRNDSPSLIYDQSSPPCDLDNEINLGIENNASFDNGLNNFDDDNIGDNNRKTNQLNEDKGTDDILLLQNVPEPEPPYLKSGRQLYELMHERGQSWATLSSFEKRKYQRAVLILKKDYIKRFQCYLENLTSQQLFKYYHEYT